MNIDGMVRDTLHSYADSAPPSAGLLDGARARARRRRMRHAGVAAAATAAVTLAILIPFGTPIGDGPVVPGSGPPPVELTEPSFELPSFPFTPGWLPSGVEAPYVSLYSYATIGAGTVELPAAMELYKRSLPILTLVHPEGPGGVRQSLMVEIYAVDPSVYFERSGDQAITVQGVSGTRFVGEEGNISIVWQHGPDQWVRVWADPSIAPSDVERYAQQLEATPLPADPPFTLELVPESGELNSLGPDHMSFTSGDEVTLEARVSWNERAVGPILTSPTPTADPSPEPSASGAPPSPSVFPSGAPPRRTSIEVDGLPAELTEWDSGTTVDIYLGQDWVLSVFGTLNRDDLVRVAEGIELTSAARPFGVLGRSCGGDEC